MAAEVGGFLLFVAVVLVLGIAAAVAIIRTLRSQSYRTWPSLIRWAFLAVVTFLVLVGAAGLVNNYRLKWGWAAALWLLAAPFIYGLIQGWPTARRP